jgi:hypothetical protein
MKLKLQRDHVISVVKGKDLVGVYIKTDTDILGGNYDDDGLVIPRGTEILLAEFSPEKADKIIKLWNSK